MKICVFADVHGNYKQFEKLTQSDDFLSADIRLCLGDMVGLGPYQKEGLDLLCKFDHIMLLGNHEARMTKYIDDLNPIYVETCKQFDMYREQLLPYMDFMKSLPKEFEIEVAGKKILFTHYGWHNGNMANKYRKLQHKSLTEQFGLQNKHYDYVIYGHMHAPSEIVENKTTFICIGSLGLKCPGNYLMIDDENDKLNIERKYIHFDKDDFLKDCEKLNYPAWDMLKCFSFSNEYDKDTGHILLTGGAGYIGSNIAQTLAKRGYKVIIVDNFSNSHREIINNLISQYPNNLKLYEFDLLDKEKLNDLFEKENIYFVIHMAAKKYVGESFEKEQDYYLNNVLLTKNLLEIMTKYHTKSIVFSSSITVYGKPTTDVVDENQICSPLSPYAKHKLDCEKLIKEWQEQNDGFATILRLSNPVGANVEYGLGDFPKTDKYKGVLPYIIDEAKQNKKLVFNGGDHPTKDGTTIRDYIHVEDVAKAFLNAIEFQIKGTNIYNIGSGEPGYSVLDILNLVEKHLNKKIDYSFGPKRDGDVSIFISNNKKAKKEISFSITKSLDDMVKSQVEFSKKIK